MRAFYFVESVETVDFIADLSLDIEKKIDVLPIQGQHTNLLIDQYIYSLISLFVYNNLYTNFL